VVLDVVEGKDEKRRAERVLCLEAVIQVMKREIEQVWYCRMEGCWCWAYTMMKIVGMRWTDGWMC